jgi:hypothetical protein
MSFVILSAGMTDGRHLPSQLFGLKAIAFIVELFAFGDRDLNLGKTMG